MFKWFLPREDQFFPLFRTQVQKILEGVRAVRDLLENYERIEEKAHQIHRIEHEADEICHNIYNTLDSMFVTPLDREDIHALAASIDGIMDQLDAGAKRMALFQIDAPMLEMQQLAQIVERSCHEILGVIDLLERKEMGKIKTHLTEINRLENEGDRVNHGALSRIFSEEKDAIRLIKMKEVVEFFEAAVDSCEHVANVVESIIVKNS